MRSCGTDRFPAPDRAASHGFGTRLQARSARSRCSACLRHHLPEPFPTTLSGPPWGGRVVGNGGGRPPEGTSQAGGATGTCRATQAVWLTCGDVRGSGATSGDPSAWSRGSLVGNAEQRRLCGCKPTLAYTYRPSQASDVRDTIDSCAVKGPGGGAGSVLSYQA